MQKRKTPANREFERYHRDLLEDGFDEFMESLARKPRRAIRINTLKTTQEDMIEFLEKNNVEYSQVPWCPEGIYIDSPFEPDTIEHQLGYYYVQTASSMIPPRALKPKPGESILDLCAAPGSKTTQIGQEMCGRGLLVANEASHVRVRALVINIQRCGLTNCAVTRQDGCHFHKYGARFDKVLLDAPCSDIGTARKNPDVISRWSPDRARNLSSLQKKLITSAYKSLNDKGVLVYSTCTTSREENEEVIEYLLEETNARLEKIEIKGLETRPGMSGKTRKTARVMPQDNDTESYYIAKVRKR